MGRRPVLFDARRFRFLRRGRLLVSALGLALILALVGFGPVGAQEPDGQVGPVVDAPLPDGDQPPAEEPLAEEPAAEEPFADEPPAPSAVAFVASGAPAVDAQVSDCSSASNFAVEFVSAVDNGDGTTTFTYELVSTNPDCAQETISHLVVNTCFGDDGVVPGPESISQGYEDPDPSTGVTGFKFGDDFGAGTQFTLTVPGVEGVDWEIVGDGTSWTIKKSDQVSGTVEGPNCEAPEPGSITIVKNTGLDSGEAFSFTFAPDGDPAQFQLEDTQSLTQSSLSPGDYTVLEPANLLPEFWQLGGVDCVLDEGGSADYVDVTDGVVVSLAAREDVTCTFTNVEVSPAPAIAITKTVDPTVGSPGDVVTYTYLVENTGQVTLENVTVVDDKLGPITLADTTLDPSETTTGTAQYTLTDDDIGELVNVAIVTGDPEDGQDPVTDDDDAIVEVAEVEPTPPEEPQPQTSVEGTQVQGTTVSQLPVTGIAIGGLIGLALALVGVGLAVHAGTRRPRKHLTG